MYSDDPNVAKAQKIMLDMLLIVHDICEENGIKYFLDAGTLLGAVRHKGFIPWDDDMDIAMSRADYEKFCNIAPQKLPKGYFFQTKKTDPEFPMNYAKIRKEGTLLIEAHETGKENFAHGVFIDIFPFDYYNSKGFINFIDKTRRLRAGRNKLPRGLKRSIYTFFTHWLLAIPHEILEFLRPFLNRHHNWYGNDESEYMSYPLDCIFTIYYTKREDFYPVRLVENCFEGHSFYLPNNPDAILTEYFGDYMTPPPVDQRQAHAKVLVVDEVE